MGRRRSRRDESSYTDLQLMKMRAALAGQRIVECGRCGKPAQVRKHRREWGEQVEFACRACGARGTAANIRRRPV